MRTLSDILVAVGITLALALMVMGGYILITMGYDIWRGWGDPFGLFGMIAGALLMVFTLGIVVSSFIEED